MLMLSKSDKPMTKTLAMTDKPVLPNLTCFYLHPGAALHAD